MYLWVVLATFIVAILSYNLSVRPDMDRTYMETKAKTAIARFRLQHSAFYSYIDSKRLMVDKQYQGGTVPYFSGLYYNNNKLWHLDNHNYASEISTTTGLNVNDIQPYLPAGYTPRADIYSKVFCFKQTPGDNGIESDYTKVCENDGMEATCCSESNVAVYVVSFQPMPSSWLNKSGRPTSDMMIAITKTDGYGKSFGYNQVKDTSHDLPEEEKLPNYPIISGGFGYGVNNSFTLKYQRIYPAILADKNYQDNCAGKTCFIAIKKVQNREGVNND
ncbi:MAG: hypothetical protein J6X42_06040 [Alphaproteobacteria bacterium]|nr:hypothetical protein [Alphaproteobacteria bacterium]